MKKEVKICLHCGQTMMIYRRNIRKCMLYCLRKLFKRYQYGSVKVADLEPVHVLKSDFEKLRYWGLIQADENSTWSITDRGVDFILGKISIPKYVYLYNKQLQEGPEDEINPNIYCWEIAPQEMSKESVLEDATSFPRQRKKQYYLFEG